jgi:hypothetical protein
MKLNLRKDNRVILGYSCDVYCDDLKFLDAANWLNPGKPIVSYTYMYIDILDNLNIMEEYNNWQYRTG